MGMALEVTTGFTVAQNALTNVTLATGNSLTVKNANPNSKILLIQLWADTQAAGIVELRSPKMHDNVHGIRSRIVTTEVQPLLPEYFRQPLYAQDNLTFQLAGSGTAGDVDTAAFLIWYEDLPGAEGRFISPADVYSRMVNLVTVEVTNLAAGSGGYSGEVALNSTHDLLKANVDYALMGYECSAEAAVVGIRGPDTANLRLGGPGSDTDKHLTRHWYEQMSKNYGIPLMPIINAANKASTLCDCANDENTISTVVNYIFAELMPTR